ncbi:hypothetical protein EV702DRAFT_1119873 [Suillus placidus]|uniref:DUF6533 domain-containing protein n=1 Tax=Suillus placidus TaxID=48579 RepID=A0A9P6ZS73_9AGAM|nr:hypothetical protein EV702DRAFT_1119873 [Suillus placidus]
MSSESYTFADFSGSASTDTICHKSPVVSYIDDPTSTSSTSRLSLNSSMTLVSNDPIWWPIINSSRVASYFMVAGSAGVIYDLVLTLGQEVELIWMQRWSLMSILYLSVRYLGVVYSMCVWMVNHLVLC